MDYWQQQDQTYSDRLLAQRLAYAEQHQQATAEAYNALQARHAQLWQAGQTAYDRQQWDSLCRLTWALGKPVEGYLDVRGHWKELRQLLSWGQEAAQALGNQYDEAAFMGNLAIALQDIGDYATARQYYEQVLAIMETLGDKAGLAISYHQLGILAQAQGDYATARQRYEQSLAIGEALGNQAGLATSYHQLGNLSYLTGDYAIARQRYEQSLAIFEALGNKAGLANLYHDLGMLAQAQRDYATAHQRYEQSLAIKEALGNQAGLATTYGELASLAREEGDLITAEQLYRQAWGMAEALGNIVTASIQMFNLATMYEKQGRLAEAVPLLEQAAQIQAQVGHAYAASSHKKLVELKTHLARVEYDGVESGNIMVRLPDTPRSALTSEDEAALSARREARHRLHAERKAREAEAQRGWLSRLWGWLRGK